MKFAATTFLSVLVTSVPSVQAFSPLTASSSSITGLHKASKTTSRTASRWMAGSDNDANQDGAQITSARKELKFDDKTGRFFETNLETEECIPDEEFCTIDEDTGAKIRLTVAEKERIFLDAIQVRSILSSPRPSQWMCFKLWCLFVCVLVCMCRIHLVGDNSFDDRIIPYEFYICDFRLLTMIEFSLL